MNFVLSELKDLVNAAVQNAIFGTIDAWITRSCEAIVAAIAGLFTIFTYTPSYFDPNMRLTTKLWGVGLAIGIAFVLIGTMHLAWRLLNQNEQRPARPARRFAILGAGATLCVASLWILEMSVRMQNYLWTLPLNLPTVGGKPDATVVMGVAFGNAGVVGLINSVGIVFGIWTIAGMMFLALLTFARFFVHCSLPFITPMYAGVCTMSEEWEPLFGLGNLVWRTEISQTVHNFGWLILGWLTGATGGEGIRWLNVTPLVVCAPFVTLMVVFDCWFWLWPTMQTLANPLTLNGARAGEAVGRWGGKLGSVLTIAGTVMAQPELAALGMKTKQASRTLQEKAQDLQQKPLLHRLQEQVQHLDLEPHEPGTGITTRDVQLERGGHYTAVAVPASIKADVVAKLQKQKIGFTDKGSELWVLPDTAAKVKGVANELVNGAYPVWRARDGGYIAIVNKAPTHIGKGKPPGSYEVGPWTGTW